MMSVLYVELNPLQAMAYMCRGLGLRSAGCPEQHQSNESVWGFRAQPWRCKAEGCWLTRLSSWLSTRACHR